VPDEKPKKVRKPRRNFAREIERVTLYLETIIRIKSEPLPSELFTAGETADVPRMIEIAREAEVRAYSDVKRYLLEIQGGAK